MYPELKNVYNGKVPEEVYNRLIEELEAQLQEVFDAYNAELARIKRDLERRRQRKK